MLLQIGWNNPFAGKNSCGASVTGECPRRFRATSHCGSGNNPANRYDLYLSPWRRYSGCGLDIAVGASGAWLVGVNRDGNIYRGEPDGSDWHSIDGCAHDIAVGGDGSVWVVGCSDTSGGYVIRRRANYHSAWEKVKGGGLRIAVGPDGIPWLVNSEGKIYQGRTVNNVWDWDPRPGCAKDIGVGANGVPWIIGCDRVSSGYSIYKWAHPERSDPWERQPGGGSEISVAADGRPWIVNNAHNIYRRADP